MKIDYKYILFTAIAVFLSFELHELSHYLAGEFLGNKMVMTLNSGYPANGYYLKDWHYLVVSAAGPLFTIIQAIVFYYLLKRGAHYYLYPFLLIPFFLRFSALVISFRNPNDEARISKTIGIGTFTLPVIVSIFLFFLVYKINRRYHYSSRFNFLSVVLILFFYSAIILSDKYFHIRLL